MVSKKQLIEKRVKDFLGYGNMNSDVWFIGPEEGGYLGDLKCEAERTDGNYCIDIQSNMSEDEKWFSDSPPTQPTWRQLIRILLTLEDEKDITLEKIRCYQRDKFGRSDGNHCILELSALPCRNLDEWTYTNKYDINYLESKKEYFDNVVNDYRIKLLQEQIKKRKPRLVICYSIGYYGWWEKIINCRLQRKKNLQYSKLFHCKNYCTDFFIIPHPSSRGKTEIWDEIAKYIKQISGFELNPST